ncbi:MAG: response regulator [Candidatus Omnitrophica bacterium]|nr:response regulator [Candidatus Omnitrophota bacterium]
MKRILIVDDNSSVRGIYTRLLASVGYDVVEASNACDANEIVKRNPIDLILLDIRMPEVDGSIMYEVLRTFHKGVKIIVSSVYPLERQKKVIAGATDYYDKSRGIDELLQKVTKACS